MASQRHRHYLGFLLATTHISHTTVASMGKAIKVLNVTIHAPGFGSKLATLGTQLANK